MDKQNQNNSEKEKTSVSFQYVKHIEDILRQVQETQWTNIDHAAKVIASAIVENHSVFVFGASHASIIAQELFYRTGGLAVINAILPSEFMLNIRPITQTSAMERLDGYPKVILDHAPIQKNDVLILHSVSGRNPAAIEMAMEANAKGIQTIALTNMEYTKEVTSRHKSGKKLFEVCSIVIDNCGDFEDSSMLLDGLNQKIAPTSSVIGCTIANMLEIRIVEYLLDSGIEPPIFHSANVDGGEAFNTMLFEKYKNQIHYM
jgi:uncharacterized phosphosugar-binding protein